MAEYALEARQAAMIAEPHRYAQVVIECQRGSVRVASTHDALPAGYVLTAGMKLALGHDNAAAGCWATSDEGGAIHVFLWTGYLSSSFDIYTWPTVVTRYRPLMNVRRWWRERRRERRRRVWRGRRP